MRTIEMKSKIIAIMGSPGVGKTYLSKKLATHFGWQLIEQPPVKDRILENLTEQKRDFETLTYFLVEGIKNIKKAVELKKKPNVVMDTCWLSTMLHVKSLLGGFEEELMREEFELLEEYLPKPDEILYLTAPNEFIEKKVIERQNTFDTTEEYLKRIFSIKKEHDDYFKKNSQHKVIDRSGLDFDREEDLITVISILQ